MSAVPLGSLAVVPHAAVREVLDRDSTVVLEIIKAAYELHAAGQTNNPDSHFLRFDSTPNRIIALPAFLKGNGARAGLKWISSFPGNKIQGLPRASAAILLNDMETGFPLACIEGSAISAARTGASAALALGLLFPWEQSRLRSLAVVGCGPIARSVLAYVRAAGFEVDELRAYDLVDSRASDLLREFQPWCANTVLMADVKTAVADSEVVLLATTAAVPHLTSPEWFDGCRAILHISLRDLAPEIILRNLNYADDVGHALKANTSLHLTEQAVGHRSFVQGGMGELLAGHAMKADLGRTRIFSPFGLGILDIALANYVLGAVGNDIPILCDFFPISESHANAHVLTAT